MVIESIGRNNGVLSFKCGNLYRFDEIRGLEVLTKIIRAQDELLHLDLKKDAVILLDESKSSIPSLISKNGQLVLGFCDAFPFELTKDELSRSCENILSFLNKEYSKNGIDFRKINPMYLEQVLGVDLPFLISAKIENRHLNDLRCFCLKNEKGIELADGRYYKQLLSNSFVNVPRHVNNYLFQSNEERIKSCIEAMSGNKYAMNGEYIILYNGSNIIRDGEHRASVLFFLYGNIEVLVLILNFSKNYYSFNLYHKKRADQ